MDELKIRLYLYIKDNSSTLYKVLMNDGESIQDTLDRINRKEAIMEIMDNDR